MQNALTQKQPGRLASLSWTSALLKRTEALLGARASLKPRLAGRSKGCVEPRASHLAVFVEPFLTLLLQGKKTIESRFSINRCPPYECVKAGDLVFIKQSGGPVVAVAEVSKVWYYDLDREGLEFIRTRFGPQLCVEDPEFWERKASSCYGTLMQFSWVESISPIPCLKRDRRGWVVLETANQPSLFDDEVQAELETNTAFAKA